MAVQKTIVYPAQRRPPFTNIQFIKLNPIIHNRITKPLNCGFLEWIPWHKTKTMHIEHHTHQEHINPGNRDAKNR